MTEQEQINAEVQRKLALQDAKLNAFIEEMRDRDNQRHAEIVKIRNTAESTGRHVNDPETAVEVMALTIIFAVIFAVIFK